MTLKVVCAGYMVRHPVGGLLFHHLQFLVGLKQLGHDVTFVEHYGWPRACYDPVAQDMTDDPSTGVSIVRPVFQEHGLDRDWCYVKPDGTTLGLSRQALTRRCREADVLLNLSNINWMDEFQLCPRLALVDTDPVFSQIRGFGMGGPFERYDALFTFGENVHREGCTMPTGGAQWLATRQPIVLDLWPVQPPRPDAPITSVINWKAYGDREHEGRVYGQKDRQFEPFFTLPRSVGMPFLLAANAPPQVKARLREEGWDLADPGEVSRTMGSYQRFLADSRAEFCVAKHGYVVTGSGWFSDRGAAYMASGRPVVLQDTGYSRNLPCGEGLLPFCDFDDAVKALRSLAADYPRHCAAARKIVEEHFDARKVLGRLLEAVL